MRHREWVGGEGLQSAQAVVEGSRGHASLRRVAVRRISMAGCDLRLRVVSLAAEEVVEGQDSQHWSEHGFWMAEPERREQISQRLQAEEVL